MRNEYRNRSGQIVGTSNTTGDARLIKTDDNESSKLLLLGV